MVHNYYQIPGGEDTVVANEKKMLERHGHKIILYTRSNSEFKKKKLWNKFLLPFITVFNIKTYREIKKIIKKEKIDVIHVHNTLPLISPSVYYAAKMMKVPVVQTIHNFRMLCPGATFYRNGHICEECLSKGLKCAVQHGCYRGSKVQTLICVISTKIHRMTGIYGKINYICLTEFNKKKLLKLKQIKEEKVFIKPNFVENIVKYIPEEKRKNQFIFAGRLDRLKGIDILLEAWKELGEEAPKLIICGTGPMKDWCEDYVQNNNLNVEIKGFVPNEEVRRITADSKGMILPTQCYEGFPMSIIEAFSVGTPVLCSDLGNAGNIIENGITGIKFKNNSIKEIANAVTNCRKLCSSTFAVYKEKYTENSNYKYILKIYSKVCVK